ncbi:unnamed protein product [Phytophthora lilii]|uniref:RNA methyltransferase n=1 Tax=Phytophthora lilii TaxID=2077276 RepID=A0A9W6WYX0_9STRA|nr:unnamed protein product [Phytophthora lilii]
MVLRMHPCTSSYYTYRLGQKRQGELEDDPRLAALDRSWFEGKRGLDVGCNSGELTIAIAEQLAPSYLLGVDVDPQLVSRARGHLKDIMRQQQIEKAFEEIPAVKATAKSDSSETDTKEKAGDAFANDMPLSFRLWKPSMQTQANVPRAIGKAAVG